MISPKVDKCLDRFREILSAGHLKRCEAEVPALVWQDELGRLRVWVANTGANQTGELSLDYQLLDASHISDQVIRLLDRLCRTLGDLQMAVDEPPLERISDGEPEASDDGDYLASGIPLIYQNLVHTINSLHQISLLTRNPAAYDRFVAPTREDTSNLEMYDRQRVAEKYPRADPAIVNRLGNMISSRRSIIRYREKRYKRLCHDVLGDHLETDMPDPYGTTVTNPSPQDDMAFTEYRRIDDYFTFDEGVVLPLPPKGSANQRPFTCPYCFCIIEIQDEIQWVRHIFRDLMPYVCIFPDCGTPDKTCASRWDWLKHIMHEHSSNIKWDPEYRCPLCYEPISVTFEIHLGGHLESLVLFSLSQQRCGSIKGKDVEKGQPSQNIDPSTDHKGKSTDIATKDSGKQIQSGATEAHQYKDPIPRFATFSYENLMYICCQCKDGPKTYNMQPVCILCCHTACKYCTKVK